MTWSATQILTSYLGLLSSANRVIVTILVAIAALIGLVTPATAATRPADPAELAEMRSAVDRDLGVDMLSYVDGWPDQVELANPRVDDGALLAAADATGFRSSERLWSGVLVFGVNRDRSFYAWKIFDSTIRCDDTRFERLWDYDAEALGVFAAGRCSRGRPLKPTKSMLSRVTQARQSANRGIARLNRAWRKCRSIEFESNARVAKCMSRPVKRYYRKPVRRLEKALYSAEVSVAYAWCANDFSDYLLAMYDHEKYVDYTVDAIRRVRPDRMNHWMRRARGALARANTAWHGVRYDCR